MCTVTIIALEGGGLRLVTSRDERRGRPPATPPQWRELSGGRWAAWPTDPEGGGTWLGADDRGMVLTLLNGNPEPTPDLSGLSLRSRGLLIPELLDRAGGGRLQDAFGLLEGLDLDAFAPFRLVGTEPDGRGGVSVFDAVWDRRRLVVSGADTPPACFVSSGLGDSVVRARLPLFERMVGEEPTPEAQDHFHAHYWPDRLDQSVWMSRAGARTVSVSVVEVLPEDDGARVEMVSIPVGEPPVPSGL
ncbi:MAG: NRDE family protein [Phycisphaerales bacterium]|nr:NRDE family protein [Phycisphaerales bacterium]